MSNLPTKYTNEKSRRKDEIIRRQDTGSNFYNYGKVPPQARDLEEAVLGAIMLVKGAYEAVESILKPESFYVDAHQRLFTAMKQLKDLNSVIDILTVVDRLRRNEDLEVVGGPYFVTRLTNEVASSAHIEEHAKIIQEKFIKRELIRISNVIATDGYLDSVDAFEQLDETEKMLFELTVGNVKRASLPVPDVVFNAISHIEMLRQSVKELTGVPTGFRILDRITCGWQQPDLIIIAARPSVGKTAFALNLARNAMTHPVCPVGVGFVSLEMSSGQLMNRLLSAESKVKLEKISRGKMEDDEMQRISLAGGRISSWNFEIDDSSAMNIYELRSKARRWVTRNKIGIIFIDYLQLMSGLTEGRGMNREQEISNISRNLKNLAKELKIPIVALSQMSRAVDTRKDNKPQLSDLRESGAIEQDADVVGFIGRPEYQKNELEANPDYKNDAYFSIKKHRNGTLEEIDFKVDLSIQTWYDVEDFEQDFGTGVLPPGNWRKIDDEELADPGSKVDADHEVPLDELPF